MWLYTIVCISIILEASLISSKLCANRRLEVSLKFYPLRHCQRSNKSVITYSNTESLEECSSFAIKSRGLAFNFSPRDRYKKNLFDIIKLNETEAKVEEEFYNCEVLDCPEYKNLSSVVNDTRFDYYSLYTRPPREFKILKNCLKPF